MRHQDEHLRPEALLRVAPGWRSRTGASSARCTCTTGRPASTPTVYGFDLWVVPEARSSRTRHALYDAAIAALRSRNALAAGGGLKESMSDGVEFFMRRGWVEVRRDWEYGFPWPGSIREVRLSGGADEERRHPYSTLADERARDARADRKAYALVDQVRKGRTVDRSGDAETFEEGGERWVDSPTSSPKRSLSRSTATDAGSACPTSSDSSRTRGSCGRD